MVSEVVIVPLYHNDYSFDVGIKFAKQLCKELSKSRDKSHDYQRS